MHCPFCGGSETKVVDSRYANSGDSIRRRRECLECIERFTTYETAELSLPRVIKQDQSREAFDEEKLRRGLLKALEKRPVSVSDVEKSVVNIKRKLMSLGEKEVDSKKLGDWVMTELKLLDHVAYVRFASVYRCFQDVYAFEEEIQRLKEEQVVN
jgi:transcriptional repressor NrdR